MSRRSPSAPATTPVETTKGRRDTCPPFGPFRSHAASGAGTASAWTSGRILPLAALALLLVNAAQGQCGGAWSFQSIGQVPATTFPGSFAPQNVAAMLEWDSGGGPDLYAIGPFSMIGGVAANFIARWDGTSWHPVGGGLAGPPVFTPLDSMIVHDDGSGEALYVTGHLASAGGVPVTNIARWNGIAWSAVGSPTADTFEVLETFDDGTGTDLYAVRRDSVGFLPSVEKWDGTNWVGLPPLPPLPPTPGLPPGQYSATAIDAMAVFDDGTGTALYAGGAYDDSSTNSVGFVARWDGTTWTLLPLLFGIDNITGQAFGHVQSLEPFGGELIASGNLPGGFNRVRAWDGTSWNNMDAGWQQCFAAPFSQHGAGHLKTVPTPLGSRLFAQIPRGFDPSPCVAIWDGQSWSAVDPAFGGHCFAIGGGATAMYFSDENYGFGPPTGPPGVYRIDYGSCQAGTVGNAAGTPFPVLFVNGGATPSIVLPVPASLTVAIQQPATTVAPAAFAIAIHLGPLLGSGFTLPASIGGSTCFAPPGLGPALWLATSTNTVPGQLLPATTAPWSLSGITIPFPLAFTLQGVIADDSSTTGLAVTNAVTVRIE